MPLRILLAVLVALACSTSQAWATGPQYGPMSGGGGASLPWVDITSYAACDGTDETTAIQAAVTAACGGTLYVPAKTCAFSSTITGCSNLTIKGSDGSERGGGTPHRLRYDGTGTGLDFSSKISVRFEGMELRAGSGSFTSGTLLKLDSGSYFWIDRTVFIATSGQADAATSKAISANDVVGLWIEGVYFTRFGYHIYGRTLSSNYANVFSIKDTVFYRAEAYSLYNLGDFISIINSWWQAQGASDTKSSVMGHGTGICMDSFSMTGSGSIDQPNGPTVPVFDVCGKGISITGSLIAGNTTQDGIQYSEACDGCVLSGNWFTSLDEALVKSGTGANSKDLVLSNSYTTVATTPYQSISSSGAQGLFVNAPTSTWLLVDTDANSGSDAVIIASNARDNSATQQYVFYENGYAQFERGNDLRMYETDNTNYVQISAPTLAADWTLTLPTTDGNANEILQTDGSGTTTWAVDDDVPEAADYSNLTGGAGIVNSPTGTIATASDEQDFLKQSASLSCAGTTPGKLIVDTTTQTLSYCPTGSTTTKYAALGNDSGQATFLSSTSCTSGVQTAADGTPSCMTAASTPEYVSRVETAGGTIQAYGVVAANGTTDDGVIEAATTVTQIIGCSQSGSSVTSTNPVEVAVAGVARCSTDASVVSGSLVKLGATGQFALGTTAEKTWGRALTDSTGASGSAYILLFDGAEGYIDHAIDVWPSIPDLTSNTVNMINESPTVDISSNGTLRGLNFAPTSTITGTSAVRGVLYSPTVTLNGGGDLSSFYIVASGGTITSAPTTAAFGPVPVLVAHQMTYTSSTNGKSPMYQGWGLFENPTISSSGTSGTATTDSHTAADDNPTFNQTGNGGTLSITTAYGFRSRGTLTAGTGGTGTIVTRKGFAADDITTSGAGTKSITTNIGVDIAALSNGTTNIGLRNADTTVYTPPTNVTVGAAFTLTATATLQKLDASAARTSDTTTAINDGQADGQIFIIVNADSADIITIKNAANTDLGADCALNPGGVLQVIWMATASNWSQISCSAN